MINDVVDSITIKAFEQERKKIEEQFKQNRKELFEKFEALNVSFCEQYKKFEKKYFNFLEIIHFTMNKYI